MNIHKIFHIIFCTAIFCSVRSFGQVNHVKENPFKKGDDVFFKDTTTSPLAFISAQFYQKVQGLDSCCITAFGSAKFTIRKDGKIDSVWISVGVPKYIASSLEEAIYSTATYWEVSKKREAISILIPLFIAPSNLCKKEGTRDEVLDSAANMYTYQGGHKGVRLVNYTKKANGAVEGIILSPLLIKGRLSDVFNDSYKRK